MMSLCLIYIYAISSRILRFVKTVIGFRNSIIKMLSFLPGSQSTAK